MIQGLSIIFLYLFLGEVISKLLKIPVPGNVIGMVLLTASLKFGVVKLDWVKGAADVLVKNMAFLFVPPGVGIMVYFDLIKKEWLPITVAYFFSTFAVLFVVAKLQERIDKK